MAEVRTLDIREQYVALNSMYDVKPRPLPTAVQPKQKRRHHLVNQEQQKQRTARSRYFHPFDPVVWAFKRYSENSHLVPRRQVPQQK